MQTPSTSFFPHRTGPARGQPGPSRALQGVAAALGLLLACTAPVAAQDDGVWEVFLYANEIRDVVAVGEDIYAATSGGAVFFGEEGDLVQWTRAPLGVLSDSLSRVARDAAGNVWFGTERAGISILTPRDDRWEPYTSLLEPIPGDRVTSLRIQDDAEGREVLLVGGPDGYSWFVDGDLRVPCQAGVDLCDLPSYEIRDLVLAGDDLWIATAAGLVSQAPDGAWTPRNAPFTVQVLAADGNSVLAAGGAQVARWAGDAWEEVGGGLPNGITITDIVVVGANDIWLAASGTEGGVFRFQGAAFTRVGGEIFSATSLTRTDSGRMVAGAADVGELRDGVWSWDGTSWTQRKVPGPSLRAFYRSTRVDEDGVLWFSTAQSGRSPLLGTFDGERWVIRNGGENGALRAWTWSTLEVGGEVFLAHCCCSAGEDLCRLESLGEDGAFAPIDGIRETWALDLDDDGYLWASTNPGLESLAKGVYRIDPVTREWENFDAARVGFPSNQVPAIRVVDRVAWVGTSASGLVRWDFGANGVPEGDPDLVSGSDDLVQLHTTTSTLGDRIIGDAIRQIAATPEGVIWVGTTSGLSIYEGGTFTNVGSRIGGLPNAEITALAVDAEGGAWVGTRANGLTRMVRNPEGGFFYTTYQAPLLPAPNVETLALAPDGRSVWCGTTRGLARFTPFRGAGVTGTEGVVAAYPNPVIPGCVDGLRLRGGGGLLHGVVVDLDGRVLSRFGEASSEDIVWDLRDGGAAVAPGLYIVRVQGPNGIESVGVAVRDGDCP